jgi:hypothetical protein
MFGSYLNPSVHSHNTAECACSSTSADETHVCLRRDA